MQVLWAGLTAATVALLVSLATPLFITPWLKRRGVVDLPNQRSSHTVVAVRGVGIAPAAAMVIGVAIAIAAAPEHRPTLVVVAVAALIFAMLGAAEDFVGLSVRTRAALQVLLGLATSAILAAQSGMNWYVALPLGIAIAVYVNVANFMDGIDGVSGFHGLVAGATFTVVGVLSSQAWLASAGLVIAAAFAGFLPWNLRRRVFLGDVGSYLLGGAVAVVIVAGVMGGIPAIALGGVAAVYLVDVGTTLLRRLYRRERWYEAHRTHIYQRLTDTGLTHLHVALIVTGLSGLCSAAGVVMAFGPPIAAAAAGLAIVGVLVAYGFSPRIVRRLQKSNDA